MISTSQVSQSQEKLDVERSRGDLGNAKEVSFRVHTMITRRLRGSTPSARAARAYLRSAIGKEVGSIPEIWTYTLENSNDESSMRQLEATHGERAVHTALTLWALHQGSHASDMHRQWDRPRTIGSAVRSLALQGTHDIQEDHPAYKRLCAMIAAPTFEALAIHARGLISLLKSAAIPMDYARFAADLYQWQKPHYRPAVLRQWGRDFSRTTLHNDELEPTH